MGLSINLNNSILLILNNFLLVEQPLSSIKLGDKVLVKSTEKHSGGGATNSAVALVKMGVKTKILTKLGNDSDAKLIQQELNDYKIKNICQKKSKKRTDSATIISSIKEKDRIIHFNFLLFVVIYWHSDT